MRAFIAVDVSNDAIVEVQNEVFSASGWNLGDVKLVEPRNFHFTLIFLGEISNNDTDRIIDKLSGFSFEPITITYGGIGAFPKPSYARVVWVGIDSDGAQKLTCLANDITSRMFELGFRADKPFSAHMTFIRSRDRPINASYICAE
jgi:2'-5' RNA ligase